MNQDHGRLFRAERIESKTWPRVLSQVLEPALMRRRNVKTKLPEERPSMLRLVEKIAVDGHLWLGTFASK